MAICRKTWRTKIRFNDSCHYSSNSLPLYITNDQVQWRKCALGWDELIIFFQLSSDRFLHAEPATVTQNLSVDNVNSLLPSDVMWSDIFLSILAQEMAWHLLGAKPLPEPMLPYCQLDY